MSDDRVAVEKLKYTNTLTGEECVFYLYSADQYMEACTGKRVNGLFHKTTTELKEFLSNKYRIKVVERCLVSKKRNENIFSIKNNKYEFFTFKQSVIFFTEHLKEKLNLQ